jgi:hypothetical protein
MLLFYLCAITEASFVRKREPQVRFLARNIVALFILQGSVYLVPLITTPYLASVLGPACLGWKISVSLE